MTHWAAPGVQCVCIRDDFGGGFSVGPCCIPTRIPMINEVLTIRQVHLFDDDRLFLTFEEIPEYQSDSQGGLTIGGIVTFEVVCFRPLIKRKTDISVFKKMLTPAGRIPVDAA